MLRIICSMMVLCSVVFAANSKTNQNQIMPVTIEIKGHEYPVVAQKDGEYSQVWITAKTAPYFADKNGVSISLSDKKADFSLFYVDGKEFKALPMGSANPDAVRTSGKDKDAKVRLVCWGRWGCYYGGCYRPCFMGYRYPMYGCGYGGCYSNYYYGGYYGGMGYGMGIGYGMGYGGYYGCGNYGYGMGCYYPYRYCMNCW